jgi:hypothetical protein
MERSAFQIIHKGYPYHIRYEGPMERLPIQTPRAYALYIREMKVHVHVHTFFSARYKSHHIFILAMSILPASAWLDRRSRQAHLHGRA